MNCLLPFQTFTVEINKENTNINNHLCPFKTLPDSCLNNDFDLKAVINTNEYVCLYRESEDVVDADAGRV